jgi:hypothetical protein
MNDFYYHDKDAVQKALNDILENDPLGLLGNQCKATDPNTCCVCKTAEGDVDELRIEGWVTFCNPCLEEIERLQENTDE